MDQKHHLPLHFYPLHLHPPLVHFHPLLFHFHLPVFFVLGWTSFCLRPHVADSSTKNGHARFKQKLQLPSDVIEKTLTWLERAKINVFKKYSLYIFIFSFSCRKLRLKFVFCNFVGLLFFKNHKFGIILKEILSTHVLCYFYLNTLDRETQPAKRRREVFSIRRAQPFRVKEIGHRTLSFKKNS